MKKFCLVSAILLSLLLACGSEATPAPLGPPGPGPTWLPQEAIAVIEDKPRFVKDGAWNAEFNPYLGRWKVSLIYEVRLLFPSRDARKTISWLVYEDTGRVEGPLD